MEGTDSGGVEGLAVGAQGNFALLGGQLADGDRVVHPFHLADEGGDILQILLCGLEIGDESQGDIGEGQRAPLGQLHLLYQAPLQPHPLEGLDPEVAPVDPLGVKAHRHEGGGDPMGLRGGVGVNETAGVGGNGHIQEHGNLRGEGDRHGLEDPVEQLSAGGAAGVHTGFPAVSLVGAVVVDHQVDPVLVGPGAVREHAQGCHIHRHNMLGQKPRRGQDPLQIGGEKTVGVLVGQDPGGFSQLPERQAQGAGTADGVPIGPAVGEDQHLIQCRQPAGGLVVCHGLPPVSFCSMSLRSFKIWVPLSMESSSTNKSSGV